MPLRNHSGPEVHFGEVWSLFNVSRTVISANPVSGQLPTIRNEQTRTANPRVARFRGGNPTRRSNSIRKLTVPRCYGCLATWHVRRDELRDHAARFRSRCCQDGRSGQLLCCHRNRSISDRRSRYRITAVHFGQFFRCAQNAGVTRIRRNRLQGWGSRFMSCGVRKSIAVAAVFFRLVGIADKRPGRKPVLHGSRLQSWRSFRVSSRGSAVEECMY